MASPNLDLVRSICAPWERGDYSSAAWAHSEIEFVIADGPSKGRWTGRAEMAAGLRGWLSAWEKSRTDIDDYRELDGERVLVLVRQSGRGKTSGVEVGQLTKSAGGASLFHIRDGKVTKLLLYFDRARALADLGLGPETDFSDR